MAHRLQRVSAMKVDPWKISSAVTAIVFAGVVVCRAVPDAEAKPPVPVPVPHPSGSAAAHKLAPPGVQAVKLLEAAQQSLAKIKNDPEGHKARAIGFLTTALNETRPLGTTGEEGPTEVTQP